MLGIYIPYNEDQALGIPRGSAIVGAPKGSSSLWVAFADNRNRAINLKGFADRAVVAADRYWRGASSSRRMVESWQMVRVAYWDSVHGRVIVDDPQSLTALSEWLEEDPDLDASGNRFVLQRALSDQRIDPVTRSWIESRLQRS